ncbi:ATP-binding protein [Phocaeicola coprocola]|uniref:ATP-binding protein n=1 Tax=Phocaeicola coprocola TaxID=310298 RepID=UPI003AF02ACD
MFVIEIGVLCPYNSKKIMQIHDNILIAECSSYDFKEMLERKKVKSWLKSVSAFANIGGGSLFYGVNTVMGGEVHIDIYDDRVELVSPGAMLDGTQIQDRDIYKVPSMRRNPVIADMFTQLDYMEKRGSGLRKMRELTEKLPNFLPGKEPQYQTEAISFYTTFYNLNWGENGRIPIEEVANRVNSSLEKYSIDEESSVKTFGDLQKSSVKTFGDLQNSSVKQKRLGRTAQSILDLVISDGSISQDKMAEKIGVSKRAIEMQIANLKAKGLLVREGADHGGYWRIVINPKAEE